MNEQIYFRTIKNPNSGLIYLRAEDVAQMLEDIGATEVTDARNRLEEMADNIRKKFVATKKATD